MHRLRRVHRRCLQIHPIRLRLKSQIRLRLKGLLMSRRSLRCQSLLGLQRRLRRHH